MLKTLGYSSLAALVEATIPAGIRLQHDLDLQDGLSEHDALARLRQIADQNQVWRSYIGLGYATTLTPPVIQRNVLENPGLVHPVHSLPARNRPGASGSFAELPDHGDRPHRHGNCQCLPAG